MYRPFHRRSFVSELKRFEHLVTLYEKMSAPLNAWR